MRPLILVAVVVSTLAARPADDDKAVAEEEAPVEDAGFLRRTWSELRSPAPWHGIQVDGLGSFSGTPSVVNRARISMDRHLGVRAGYVRSARWFTVGAEASWRSSAPVVTGAQPFVPMAIATRITGGTPQQVIRQDNTATAGATAALRLARMGWFLEPGVLAGGTVSRHGVLVTLESPIPYNNTYWTLGLYGGATVTTGFEPVFLRMDAIVNGQLGPPPFGVNVPYVLYNVSCGVRL